MKVLGIIPARGGSKGIPGKNIRLVDGVPLISYTIKAALESELLTDFLVASDDDKILEVAETYKSNCYKRQEMNAQDASPIESVIVEVLEHLKKDYDLIILLQVTAPIRTGEDIDEVIKMFKEDSNLKNVISVIQLNDIHPARMYNVDDDSNMKPLNAEDERTQRQKLDPVFLRNGCIYAVTVEAFMQHNSVMLNDKKAYIMPYAKWLNIDEERDVILAEYMIKQWKLGKLD